MIIHVLVQSQMGKSKCRKYPSKKWLRKNCPELMLVRDNLVNKAWKFSTKRTYSSGWKNYKKFCKVLKVSKFHPSPEMLGCWLAKMKLQTSITSWSTYNCYICAVKARFAAKGKPDPFINPALEKQITGLKKSVGVAPKLLRLAVTAKLLGEILPYFPDETFVDKVCKDVAVVAVCGLFRLGEITATKSNKGKVPTAGDVSVPKRGCRRIKLKFSKRDKFGQGDQVTVAENGSVIDPVRAMDRSLAQGDGFKSGEQPIFSDEKGRPIKAEQVVSRLRLALRAAGIPEEGYHGHSFRKGGAQSLLDAGASYAEIKIAGRWSSDSWKLYVVVSDDFYRLNSARMASLLD